MDKIGRYVRMGGRIWTSPTVGYRLAEEGLKSYREGELRGCETGFMHYWRHSSGMLGDHYACCDIAPVIALRLGHLWMVIRSTEYTNRSKQLTDNPALSHIHSHSHFSEEKLWFLLD